MALNQSSRRIPGVDDDRRIVALPARFCESSDIDSLEALHFFDLGFFPLEELDVETIEDRLGA